MSVRLIWLLGLVCVYGCAVNPVTGQREIVLVSSSQEIAIGQEQYAPAQQMQGGAYNTDPALSAYVNSVGQKLAAVSGVDLPYEFVVLNNSVPNAWALPGGKIAVNRGLLTALRNESELAAVLGHEVAHAAARHGAKRMERGLLAQGVLLGAAIGTSGTEYARGVLGGAQLAAGLINQKYSRDAEREADFYGTQFMAKAGYDPYGAVTLQETFVRLAGERQSNWVQGFFASHPASQERLSNNRMLLKQLRAQGYEGGVLGQPAYAQALAHVRDAQPAFDAYDEAQSLYGDNDYDGALARVNEALAITNAEAIFHGLRGSIRYKQARYDDALVNFNRAVERDDGYFVHLLSRGLTFSKQKQRAQAKQDLSRSVRLLPTATAYQALGEIAEADGDLQSAKRYYAQAGQSQGAEGQAAREQLTRLELPEQPAKYVQARIGLDDRNRYVLQVRNLSTLAMRDVHIRIEVSTSSGIRTTTSTIAAIGGGETRVTVLRLDPSTVQDAQAYAVAAIIAD